MIDDFIITEFKCIYTANDAVHRLLNLKNRYCSCFIVTLSGSIRFTYDGGSIVADTDHPVFIPEGLSYRNECLENAVSLVFNFHTRGKPAAPTVLSRISHQFATEKYREIEKAQLQNTAESKMTVLCELYSLASKLFATSGALSPADEVVKKATEHIAANYAKSTLTVAQIAHECFVSETYLRKLFVSKMNTTPSSYITKIRMDRAYHLAKEHLPVKEIAGLVGYADIYQFSRAYKKYFGCCPSRTV